MKTILLIAVLLGLSSFHLFAQEHPTPEIIEEYLAQDNNEKTSREAGMQFATYYAEHEYSVDFTMRVKGGLEGFANRNTMLLIARSFFNFDTDTFKGYTITGEDVLNTIHGLNISLTEKKTKQKVSYHFTTDELRPTPVEIDTQMREQTLQQLKRKELITQAEIYTRDECPKVLADGSISKKAFVDEEYVVYQYNLPQDNPILANSLSIKANLLKNIEFDTQFFYKLKCMGYGVRYDYDIENTDSTLTITLTPEDIDTTVYDRSYQDSSTAEKNLSYMVVSTNADCPSNIDEYTIIDSIKVEGDNVIIYNTIVNLESKVIKKVMKGFRTILQEQLGSTPPNSFLILAIYRSGRNMEYQYSNTKMGKTWSFKFMNHELQGYGEMHCD